MSENVRSLMDASDVSLYAGLLTDAATFVGCIDHHPEWKLESLHRAAFGPIVRVAHQHREECLFYINAYEEEARRGQELWAGLEVLVYERGDELSAALVHEERAYWDAATLFGLME